MPGEVKYPTLGVNVYPVVESTTVINHLCDNPTMGCLEYIYHNPNRLFGSTTINSCSDILHMFSLICIGNCSYMSIHASPKTNISYSLQVQVCIDQLLKGPLYRIWCGVNRLGDSGVKVV